MSRAPQPFAALTREERRALRTLLIRSTAAAGRPLIRDELPSLVRAAPIASLPAAAALHRVSGSVLRGLDGIEGIPDAVRGELTARQVRSSLHHLLIVGALGEVGRRFDDAHLSWVAMKGPVVADLFYPGVGDRTYGDLDLLVARADFPKAMGILEDAGFQHDIHNWALAEEMLAGQVGMATPAVHVDLHWHLHYSQQDRRPFAFPIEEMIERRRQVVVSGVDAPTLDAADTLLTLAFHAARSDGHRLMWYKDVERSLVADEPDLDDVVERAEAYHCGAPVGLILARARKLVDAPIPPDVVDELLPDSLRYVDALTTRLESPVQLHEQPTITRWLTRSVRATTTSSLLALPERTARSLRRTLMPPPVNESDNPDEKAAYLAAVVDSGRP